MSLFPYVSTLLPLHLLSPEPHSLVQLVLELPPLVEKDPRGKQYPSTHVWSLLQLPAELHSKQLSPSKLPQTLVLLPSHALCPQKLHSFEHVDVCVVVVVVELVVVLLVVLVEDVLLVDDVVVVTVVVVVVVVVPSITGKQKPPTHSLFVPQGVPAG